MSNQKLLAVAVGLTSGSLYWAGIMCALLIVGHAFALGLELLGVML